MAKKKKITEEEIYDGRTDGIQSDNFDIPTQTKQNIGETLKENNTQSEDPEKEYRIPLPFGDDDETCVVSKEQREERNTREATQKRKEEEEHQERIKYQKGLDDIGYTSVLYGDNLRYRYEYTLRLKSVLGRKNIENIQDIPNHKDETQSKAVMLFQALELRDIDKKNDPYYKAIVQRLDRYEEIIKHRVLVDEERDEIMKLFIIGNINNPHLFYRFETFKILYKKYRFQRLFWHGLHNAICSKKETKENDKTPFLVPEDVEFLVHSINYNGCSLSDLEIDKGTYTYRIESSYKQNIKGGIGGCSRTCLHSLIPDTTDIYETLDEREKQEILDTIKKYSFLDSPGRRDTMLNHERNRIILSIQAGEDLDNQNMFEKYKRRYYYGFYSHAMQTTLGIDKNTLEIRTLEAKREFLSNFPKFIEKISLSFLSSKEYIESMEYINLYKLPDIWKKVKEAVPYYPDIELDIPEVEENIIQKVSQCLQDSIQRIKDKEKKRKGFEYAQKKDMTYKKQLENMVEYSQGIYEILKGFGVHNAMMKDREENKKIYQEEYCEFHRKQFVSRKIYTILQENALQEGDKEEIKKTVINNGAKQLMESCIHYLAERKYHPYKIFSTHTRMPSVIFYKCISQDTLFRHGYATLMKHTWPDDKERKEVRREVIQLIIQKCLKEIEGKLINHSTFDDRLYHLIEPMEYRHGKYQGKSAEIKISQSEIRENYLSFLTYGIITKNNTDKETIIKAIEDEKTTKEELIQAYNSIWDIIHDIREYIQIVIKEKKIEISSYSKEKNEYNENHPENKKEECNFWRWKNKTYEWTYSEEFIRLLCLWRLYLGDIEVIFPEGLHHHFQTFFKEIYTIKETFWKKVLGYWFAENAGINRKLNRIIDEQLFKEFGIIEYNEKQMDFAIGHIMGNLPGVIMNDMKIDIVGGNELFWTDEEIIKKMLQDFIEKRKQTIDAKRGLTGNTTQELI